MFLAFITDYLECLFAPWVCLCYSYRSFWPCQAMNWPLHCILKFYMVHLFELPPNAIQESIKAWRGHYFTCNCDNLCKCIPWILFTWIWEKQKDYQVCAECTHEYCLIYVVMIPSLYYCDLKVTFHNVMNERAQQLEWNAKNWLVFPLTALEMLTWAR